MIRDDAVVLGIESSCDETGVGIVRGQTLLANVIASSVDEHARFGGVVPEVASRAVRGWSARCWSASQQRSHMPAHLACRCMG